MTTTDRPQGDQEDRWGRMKRHNSDLRDALEEMAELVDNWCVSGSCIKPLERARALLAEKGPQ